MIPSVVVAVVALPLFAFLAWIGADLVRALRALKITAHHPFRSPTDKQRFLAHYDARARMWPVPGETRTVETSWGSTYMRIAGPADAPALVLLPGANVGSMSWSPNVEALSRDYRVYALDNIFDFGRSINARNLTSVDDFVAWLDELLDALALDDLCLAGLSYGGWIACHYALARPERLRGLVLLAPVGLARLSPAYLRKALLCLIPLERFVRALVEFTLADLAEGNAEQRQQLRDASEDIWIGMRTFQPRKIVAPTQLSDEQLRSLSPPTLLMVGASEVLYASPAAEVLAHVGEAAPQIETELVPGCGHGMTIVAADRVNHRVLAFLRDPRRARPCR